MRGAPAPRRPAARMAVGEGWGTSGHRMESCREALARMRASLAPAAWAEAWGRARAGREEAAQRAANEDAAREHLSRLHALTRSRRQNLQLALDELAWLQREAQEGEAAAAAREVAPAAPAAELRAKARGKAGARPGGLTEAADRRARPTALDLSARLNAARSPEGARRRSEGGAGAGGEGRARPGAGPGEAEADEAQMSRAIKDLVGFRESPPRRRGGRGVEEFLRVMDPGGSPELPAPGKGGGRSPLEGQQGIVAAQQATLDQADRLLGRLEKAHRRAVKQKRERKLREADVFWSLTVHVGKRVRKPSAQTNEAVRDVLDDLYDHVPHKCVACRVVCFKPFSAVTTHSGSVRFFDPHHPEEEVKLGQTLEDFGSGHRVYLSVREALRARAPASSQLHVGSKVVMKVICNGTGYFFNGRLAFPSVRLVSVEEYGDHLAAAIPRTPLT